MSTLSPEQEKKVIQWLVNTGHIYSPLAIQEGGYDPATGVGTLSDRAIKGAIVSAQSWFASIIAEQTMLPSGQGGKNRQPLVDGEPHLGFLHLVDTPRCGEPDFQLPYAQVLEGRFLDRCVNSLTLAHRLSFRGIPDINLPRLLEETIFYLTEHIQAEIVLDQSRGSEAHFWEVMQEQGGNILARHQLQQDSCGTVRGWYDINRDWSEALAMGTLVHELMHGYGSPHSNDPNSTIYPSITAATMRRRGRMTETDVRMLTRLGYTRRVPPKKRDDPEEPPPPVPNGKLVIRGELVGEFEGQQAGTFIVVPKPVV